MRDPVHEWKQEGRIFVWRYAEPNRSWSGWHFTGDPTGCRSLRDLLARMSGGIARYRTLDLAPVTQPILAVPNYGHDIKGCFEKLRIEFLPEFPDLRMETDANSLTMTVGESRVRDLAAAFAEVEIGRGDFAIQTSDGRQKEQWMFWWMLTEQT